MMRNRYLFTSFCLLGVLLIATSPVRAQAFEESFDAIALVQYPSRKAFFEMVASEEYQAIHPHRDRGLESQWLFASTPQARLSG